MPWYAELEYVRAIFQPQVLDGAHDPGDAVVHTHQGAPPVAERHEEEEEEEVLIGCLGVFIGYCEVFIGCLPVAKDVVRVCRLRGRERLLVRDKPVEVRARRVVVRCSWGFEAVGKCPPRMKMSGVSVKNFMYVSVHISRHTE